MKQLDSSESSLFQHDMLVPSEKKRASETIYDQIRDLIISGTLKPGERLPSERNLMERLQRSRPTIREALRMLERDRFIRTIPGSNGAIIQELSTHGLEESLKTTLQMNQISVKELGEYRDHNAAQIALWAAERRTEEDLSNLRDYLIKAAQNITDYKAFFGSSTKFHEILAKAAHNQVAYILTCALTKITEQYILDLFASKTQEEQDSLCRQVYDKHMLLYTHILSQDIEKVEEAMKVRTLPFSGDGVVVFQP